MRKNLFQLSIPYWLGKRLFVEAFLCVNAGGGRMFSITFWSGRSLRPATNTTKKQTYKGLARLEAR